MVYPEGHLDQVLDKVLYVIPEWFWKSVLTKLVLLDWFARGYEVVLHNLTDKSQLRVKDLFAA